jgi:hypothetical protein
MPVIPAADRGALQEVHWICRPDRFKTRCMVSDQVFHEIGYAAR